MAEPRVSREAEGYEFALTLAELPPDDLGCYFWVERQALVADEDERWWLEASYRACRAPGAAWASPAGAQGDGRVPARYVGRGFEVRRCHLPPGLMRRRGLEPYNRPDFAPLAPVFVVHDGGEEIIMSAGLPSPNG